MRFFAAVTSLALGIPVAMLAAGAQSSPPQGRWPGQRQAAIALTYDDALASQLDVAIPQLDAAGLKGSFFLMGRQVGPHVARWKAAAATGHELGNHTINHPCAKGSYETPAQYTSEAYTVDTLLTEIGVMNGFLEAMDGLKEHSFATPCGQNLASGRDYLVPLVKSGPAPFVRDSRTMPAQIQGTGFVNASGAEMIKWVEGVRQSRAAGVVVFHGVGGDYLSVSGEAHKELVSYLKAHEGEIWTTTFRDLMKAASR